VLPHIFSDPVLAPDSAGGLQPEISLIFLLSQFQGIPVPGLGKLPSTGRAGLLDNNVIDTAPQLAEA